MDQQVLMSYPTTFRLASLSNDSTTSYANNFWSRRDKYISHSTSHVSSPRDNTESCIMSGYHTYQRRMEI